MFKCICYHAPMDTIKRNDTGAAVEDIQQKLSDLGFLAADAISAVFDDATAQAVEAFCESQGIEGSFEVDDRVWAALLDASYRLGDRTLFLRMPYFHGNDVHELQEALNALGFACGSDAIFGAHTETALRRFQTNMGLPSDGIAGAFTYRAIKNLRHSWQGKPGPQAEVHLGFARAADVLERNPLCLFGTDEFTRSVASRISNVALATNPASKILSADSLLVPPDDRMMLVHIVVDEPDAHHRAPSQDGVPAVAFNDEATLGLRLRTAIAAASQVPPRITIGLPGRQWEDAGEGRSAQHYAITLLDALCTALSAEQGL